MKYLPTTLIRARVARQRLYGAWLHADERRGKVVPGASVPCATEASALARVRRLLFVDR